MLVALSESEEFVQALTLLFEDLWKGQDPPDDWAESCVAWLFKKGSADDCSNYHGISLMSTVAKLWGKLLADRVRVSVYLELNCILHRNMLGFRSRRCCVDAIVMVLCTIPSSRAAVESLKMCFIDIRKAFPRVQRDILMQMLAPGLRSKGSINYLIDS